MSHRTISMIQQIRRAEALLIYFFVYYKLRSHKVLQIQGMKDEIIGKNLIY